MGASGRDLSGSYVAYVGTHATPVTDANATRPDVAGPVYWVCANGVTPNNAQAGDLVWNAEA